MGDMVTDVYLRGLITIGLLLTKPYGVENLITTTTTRRRRTFIALGDPFRI